MSAKSSEILHSRIFWVSLVSTGLSGLSATLSEDDVPRLLLKLIAVAAGVCSAASAMMRAQDAGRGKYGSGDGTKEFKALP